MFIFDRIDAQRIAVSAAGALVFSALCVGSAISPAQAATSAASDVVAWQTNATHRLDRTMAPVIADARSHAVRDAWIGVTVDRDGTTTMPTILQSSGNRRVDARLLQRAARLKLAPMPAGLTDHGKPVELRIALIEDIAVGIRTMPQVRYAAK